MDIKGTLTAEVTSIGMKADTKNDGQRVLVDTNVRLDREQAEQVFGEGFAFVAFGAMRNQVVAHDDGDETVTQFGYSTKKPPKWLRPSSHHVDLWGVKDKTQPEILGIIAGDNIELVTVKMRFDISSNGDESRIGQLGVMTGKQAKIKLRPEKASAFPASAPQPEAGGNGTVHTLAGRRKKKGKGKQQPAQPAV